MKTWRQYPHLFANGKFDIRVDSDAFDDTCDPVQFIRISNLYKQEFLTLIARKIEDMTDEEVYKLYDIAPIGHPDDFSEDLENEEDREFVKENCKHVTDGFLYLLSIGVYPFDQSHFEDGSVINIKDLEK